MSTTEPQTKAKTDEKPVSTGVVAFGWLPRWVDSFVAAQAEPTAETIATLNAFVSHVLNELTTIPIVSTRPLPGGVELRMQDGEFDTLIAPLEAVQEVWQRPQFGLSLGDTVTRVRPQRTPTNPHPPGAGSFGIS